MIKYLRQIIYGGVGLFLTLTNQVEATQLELFLIKNPQFAGDYDQLKGAERAIIKEFNQHDIIVRSKEYDLHQLDQLAVRLTPTQSASIKKLVLCVGTYGIEALGQLRETCGHHFTAVHLSHQKLDQHKEFVENDLYPPLVIALPTHAIDQNFREDLKQNKIPLIETIGVCQNIQPQDIEQDYQSLKNTLPHSNRAPTKYLAVMLGGDTQNPDGKGWQYYREAEAQKLAKYIAHLAREQGYTVLIANGPRTGKFNPQTKQERRVHQNMIIDPVTQTFIHILEQEGLPAESFKLFDFQKGKPSAWKGILGCLAHHPESLLLIEGGSTSMISQALANLPPQVAVVIYQHGAMAKPHLKHMKLEYKMGRASILTPKMKLKLKPQVGSSLPRKAAEEILAQELYQILSRPLEHSLE
jgi:hypothetical protein